MTARFEVFHDPDEALPFRFRLRAEDGAVVAVSGRLGSICAVKAAITAVRESAATGLVVDMTGSRPAGNTPGEHPPPASPDGE
ncbi:YegP family protein [Arthrobacter sp. ISL-5]|uniref:YegP family protein n=1 Tax=Arthrobacter sp. ISL-5 TaxID=2819111 RepID=UPI001BEA0C84|nr:YegP family protein [Arthrobacter sp. ISL-5]MBT2551566.1 YegP family protein [Arthrobacter sp. ISL-5]